MTCYNPIMPRTKPPRKHSGRRGDPISLAPLTPDQAMAALLKVKLSDVEKLGEREAKAGKKKR